MLSIQVVGRTFGLTLTGGGNDMFCFFFFFIRKPLAMQYVQCLRFLETDLIVIC